MGEPDIRNGMSSMAEYIGHERATRGIETSQYLEEKKSNETPKVAASESGGGQTSCRTGVVGPREEDYRD